jgi:cytochrome P450
MTERSADKEGEGFFLNDPQKLFDPFPHLRYFRENHPVLYYPPLGSWFIFSYDDVVVSEIVSNAMLLLLAGHVAVRNLVGNAVYLMLTHPDQFTKLKADPALLHNVIEETLRYEPPVTMIPRIAGEDFEYHGNAIRQSKIVQLNNASANRDIAYFPDGERFDILRKPGKHLSLGHGPHGCLGALLAREEAQIALETLFRRMPRLALDESKEIQWYRNAGNRGPITLPLIF